VAGHAARIRNLRVRIKPAARLAPPAFCVSGRKVDPPKALRRSAPLFPLGSHRMPLKQQLTDDMKAAMKSGDKPRLMVIRLMLAAIKQREVDERIELDDAAILAALEKMLKQRRDSVSQYEAAAREDLAAQERYEIGVIQAYLPAQMDDAELAAEVAAAIAASGAQSAADMGKVMAVLKPRIAGRADMGQASALVRKALAG
jgi:uncharacterized protein